MKNSANSQSDKSGQGIKAKQFQEAASNASDIRMDKVNEVRSQIAEGRFRVESEAVADKILQGLLVDSKLL